MTIHGFITRYNITAEATRAESNPYMDDMPAGSTHWHVTLRRGSKHQMTVPWSQGPAVEREPDAARVLECLAADAVSDGLEFEAWAGEYGYDSDSRKAERIYTATKKQTAALKRFLGSTGYDALNSVDFDL